MEERQRKYREDTDVLPTTSRKSRKSRKSNIESKDGTTGTNDGKEGKLVGLNGREGKLVRVNREASDGKEGKLVGVNGEPSVAVKVGVGPEKIATLKTCHLTNKVGVVLMQRERSAKKRRRGSQTSRVMSVAKDCDQSGDEVRTETQIISETALKHFHN